MLGAVKVLVYDCRNTQCLPMSSIVYDDRPDGSSGDGLMEGLPTNEAEGTGPVMALMASDCWAVTALQDAAMVAAITARCATALDPPVMAEAVALWHRKSLLAILNSKGLLQVIFLPLLASTYLPHLAAHITELVSASAFSWCS